MSSFSLVIGSADQNQQPVEIQIFLDSPAVLSNESIDVDHDLTSNTFGSRESLSSSLPFSTSSGQSSTSFLTSTNEIQPLTARDKSNSFTNLNLSIKTTETPSSQPSDNLQVDGDEDRPRQPPVTARIEISPSTHKGAPMKIAIKPAPIPTPRHSQSHFSTGGIEARPSPLPRYAYASSSAAESWDTSSEDSCTPRDRTSSTSSQMSRKISTNDVIASQRSPRGGDVEIIPSPSSENTDHSKQFKNDTTADDSGLKSSLTSGNVEDSSDGLITKTKSPVEETVSKSLVRNVESSLPMTSETLVNVTSGADVQKDSTSASLSPRCVNSPHKVPPPVAPKPRLSSSSSVKSDDGEQQSPSPSATGIVKNSSKISAGYERLQAIAKAKPAKVSRVIEKSRTNVTSKAKMFETPGESEDVSLSKKTSGNTPSKLDMNRINSSLRPISERRQSTGGAPYLSKPLQHSQLVSNSTFTQQQGQSFARPKSIFSKSSTASENAIPEATSPREDTSPNANSVKSPTRINSALSPRRASSVDMPSSTAFKFSQKTAPKLKDAGEPGKTINSALSPLKPSSPRDNRITSPPPPSSVSPCSSLNSSHNFDSRSHSVFYTKSQQISDNDKLAASPRRKSTSSLLPGKSLTLPSPMNKEVLEDTLKKFDDLLVDAPYIHTETDPSELLLWTPVRKGASPVANALQKNNTLDSMLTTASENKDTKKSYSEIGPPSTHAPDDQSELPPKSAGDNEPLSLVKSSFNKESDVSSTSKEGINEQMKEIVVEEIMTFECQKSDTESVPKSESLDGDKYKSQIASKKYNFEHLMNAPSCADSNVPAMNLAEEILLEDESENSNFSNKIDDESTDGDTPRSQITSKPYNFEQNLINKPSHASDNLLALNIAEEISQESTNKDQSEYLELGNKNDKKLDMNGQKEEALKNSHDHFVRNLEHSLVSQLTNDDLSQNILATNLASSITTQNEEYNSTGLKAVEDEIGNRDDDIYTEHARKIVDEVIEKITQDPSFSDREIKTSTENETISPTSSEDEPPPLPGAPPPPIIFRTSSAMLTDRDWLDDDNAAYADINSSKVKEPEIKEEGGSIPTEFVEVDNSNDVGSDLLDENINLVSESFISSKHTAVECSAPVMPLPATMEGSSSLESQLLPRSSGLDQFDLNVVGQHMAMSIREEIYSLDEEESQEAQSRSDSVEPLNSTGDSSNNEPYALRVSSPNSVDVLSEDSGMPADDEFQEVNTDDALSPSHDDVKDFVVDHRRPSDKPFRDLAQTSSESLLDETVIPDPSTTVTDITITSNSSDFENHTQPTSPSPPPPMLPASAPPDFTAALPNYNDFDPSNSECMPHVHSADSFPQVPTSSDSQPLLNEVSSNGDESNIYSVMPATDVDDHGDSSSVTLSMNESTPIVADTFNATSITETKNIIPISKTALHISTDESLSERLSSVSSEESNSSTQDDKLTVEVDVFSPRSWRVYSNKSTTPGSAIFGGEPNSSLHICQSDEKMELLPSTMQVSDFEAQIAKANEILDGLQVTTDAQIYIFHIHRDKDSVPLGIELRHGEKEFYFKVTSITANSPVANQGDITQGDILLAIDSLWCTQCSLMRCMARITKPKHDSVLVMARPTSQAADAKDSPNENTADVGQSNDTHPPAVAPRSTSSHGQVPPLVKPRQNKLPSPSTPLNSKTTDLSPSSSPEPPSLPVAMPRLESTPTPTPTTASSAPISKMTTASPMTPVEVENSQRKDLSDLTPSAPKSNDTPSDATSDNPAESQQPAMAATPEQPSSSSSSDNALAASETGVLEVYMLKGATGVGFCLEGGVGSPKGNMPITIKRIFKGGPAEKCGQLKVKDEIIEVNGVSFDGMRHYEAWNHLKFLDDGEVKLKIRRL